MQKLFIFLILTLSIAVSLPAQESSASDNASYRNSIQTNPIGFLVGSYGANFEHRFTPKHAILIEGGFSNSDEAEGYSLSLHYRYYKKPYKDAKFLFIKSDTGIPFRGIFIRKMDIEGKMKVVEDDVTTNYGYSYDAIHIGANFGKTYLWDSGITLCYRFGYGFPIDDFTWSGAEPPEADLLKGVYRVFSGFDFGLTIGYRF